LTGVIKYDNIQETRMPQVELVLYRETDGSVPLRDWLDRLPLKVRGKCFVTLERLKGLGNELRRPTADYLRDGIYELRVRFGNTNYRMLYFFAGRQIVVVSHGLTKEQVVPVRDIALAEKRRQAFLDDPRTHTFMLE
jgi:phage-related protein